ncbi:MAG TPA: cation:proton antiporter [Blastocatellia bacterium]
MNPTHTTDVIHIVSGIMALLLVAALVRGVTKRPRLPFAVVLVLVGIGLNLLSGYLPGVLPSWHDIELSSSLILYVFLPSLIFESAFNLDIRQLRENLAPVLTLAVPGLLLSTGVIGGLVYLATPTPLAPALLLGAILSATDPVAVLAVFKRLGVPLRLRTVVEGESLFNDASSLVVARLILASMVGSLVSNSIISTAVGAFIVVFGGGLVAGWILGRITGYALGRVEDNFIEITLTTVLAYVSFIVAEQILHVSGIMATIAAGLAIGGWGRMKVSAPVRTYLEHFWEYIAFVANALIFLMVGLRVDLRSLWAAGALLGWVVLALLLSRAIVVFGLLPLAQHLPGARPLSRSYQTIIYWGGLRGAIALAIVLSLPQFAERERFIAVVMGAVLFTLLANGLTIEPLVRRLGLNHPLLADLLAKMEGDFAAGQRALTLLPDLVEGGQVSGATAGRLEQELEKKQKEIKAEIEELHSGELNDDDQQRALLYLRGLAEERSLYVRMFDQSRISERAFRQLIQVLDRQIDAVRDTGQYLESRPAGPRLRLEDTILRFLRRVPSMRSLVRSLEAARLATEYEISSSRFESSRRVLVILDELARLESTPWYITDKMRRQYRQTHEDARREVDRIAGEFPELVSDLQERLARRLLLSAKAESIARQAAAGLLPPSVTENLQEEIRVELLLIKKYHGPKIGVKPSELLQRWTPLQGVSIEDLGYIAIRMVQRTVSEGEDVVKEGCPGQSMYFISSGALRVTSDDPNADRDGAMLIAGDWFGEEAILGEDPYPATVRAMTTCSLYELGRLELEVAMGNNPAISSALGKTRQDLPSEAPGTV